MKGYEEKDLNLKSIAIAVFCLLIFVLAIVFLVKPIFKYKGQDHVLQSLNQSLLNPFPRPRLQENPLGDWNAFHLEEVEQLSTYAWEDREKQIVRVPISEAMEILLKQEQAIH